MQLVGYQCVGNVKGLDMLGLEHGILLGLDYTISRFQKDHWVLFSAWNYWAIILKVEAKQLPEWLDVGVTDKSQGCRQCFWPGPLAGWSCHQLSWGRGVVVSVGEAVLWETIKSESCALGRHLGPLSEQNKQRFQHLPLQSSARWGTKMWYIRKHMDVRRGES